MNEVMDALSQWQGTDTHVIDFDSLGCKPITGFENGRIVRAVGKDTDLAVLAVDHNRLRQCFAGIVDLLVDTSQVADPIFAAFAIASLFIVAGTTCKKSSTWMLGARYGAVGDTILIVILIAVPFAFIR